MSGRAGSIDAKPVEGPRPKLTGRAAVLVVAIVVLALLAVSPVRASIDQRERIAELERQAQILEDTNAKLRVDIAKLHDPAELERLARECLGLVKAGEIALVAAPAGAPSALSGC
jgi:cell division protein FtsB